MNTRKIDDRILDISGNPWQTETDDFMDRQPAFYNRADRAELNFVDGYMAALNDIRNGKITVEDIGEKE